MSVPFLYAMGGERVRRSDRGEAIYRALVRGMVAEGLGSRERKDAERKEIVSSSEDGTMEVFCDGFGAGFRFRGWLGFYWREPTGFTSSTMDLKVPDVKVPVVMVRVLARAIGELAMPDSTRK